jgi:predicted RNA-binding Zn ribbon-like protein
MRKPDVDTRRLVGGALCLDFANTVDWAGDGTERPAHTDVLATPVDLARWGRRLGLTAVVTTGRELAAARLLRAAVHEVFASVAAGAQPGDAAVEALTRAFAEAAAAARLTTGGGWRLDWSPDDPCHVRHAVAVSAGDLLRTPDVLARVRMCPGSNCGWLFLDRSGRRRWCSMEVCGSRAKMRRLYEQRRRSPRS